MMVYSAFIESGDSLRLFDSATSWAHFGDLGRDESLWFEPPPRIVERIDLPLGNAEDDMPPLAFELVTGMVRLADATGLGYVHTAWLLNVVITALAANVLFWLALTLGYETRTAIVATLVYGALTIALPYAKSLFREPQVTLFLLLTLLGILRAWRHWHYRRTARAAGWLLGAVLAYFAAYNIKESVLTALPAFVALAVLLPTAAYIQAHRRLNQLSLVLLGLLLVGLATVVYIEPLYNALVGLPPLAARLGDAAAYPRIALHSYLFSVGGSIWGTSPLILLGCAGAWWLWRRSEGYLVWFVVLLVIGYAVGHALLTGIHWFGGLSWTPRFLVPVIPFVWLLALPALDRIVHPRRYRAWALTALFVILCLYSAWIQFNAVSLPWLHYLDVLPPNKDPNIPDVPLEWLDGLNRIEYLRWVLLHNSWASLGFDFAWLRAGIGHWLLLFGVFGGVALLSIGIVLRRGQLGWRGLALLAGATVLLLGMMGGGLQQLYTTDGQYLATKTALHEVMDILQREAQPDDVLLLADSTYVNFMMNANHLSYPRVLALPFQPGERASDKEPVKVTSPNPLDYIYGDKAYYTALLLDYLPHQRERVWLLAHNSEFTPWAVRPLERYLAQRHYTLNVYTTSDPTVRLLEYSLIYAPNPYAFVQPEIATDLRYGDHITLNGYTLPQGDMYQAGDVLPLTLNWQTDAPLDQPAVVAWFIAPVDGSALPLQGRDTQPYEGFAPTNTWQPNVAVWDNHALRLPADMASGEYQLWVVLYQFNADGSTTRLTVTGAATLEGTVGVLPTRLFITPKEG